MVGTTWALWIPLREFAHNDAMSAIELYVDVALITSGGDDMKEFVRRSMSGELVRELAHSGCVRAIAWSLDGTLLASGGLDSKELLHRTESGESCTDVGRAKHSISGPRGCAIASPRSRARGIMSVLVDLVQTFV